MEGRGSPVLGLEDKSSSGQVSWRSLWKAKASIEYGHKGKRWPGPSPSSHGYHSFSQLSQPIPEHMQEAENRQGCGFSWSKTPGCSQRQPPN